jgi:hypothetical protein
MLEDIVPAMESVSKGGRSWVLISLEGSVSSPNLDTIAGHKHNMATVPYSKYDYPRYNRDPRFNWDEHILVKHDKELPRDLGISKWMVEGICTGDWVENHFTPPARATGKSHIRFWRILS